MTDSLITIREFAALAGRHLRGIEKLIESEKLPQPIHRPGYGRLRFMRRAWLRQVPERTKAGRPRQPRSEPATGEPRTEEE